MPKFMKRQADPPRGGGRGRGRGGGGRGRGGRGGGGGGGGEGGKNASLDIFQRFFPFVDLLDST